MSEASPLSFSRQTREGRASVIISRTVDRMFETVAMGQSLPHTKTCPLSGPKYFAWKENFRE
jgi:hypothetical protein